MHTADVRDPAPASAVDPAIHVEAAHLVAAAQALQDASMGLTPAAAIRVLPDLATAMSHVGGTFHQLAGFHDCASSDLVGSSARAHALRAEHYNVSWELHRAAEMVDQVAHALTRIPARTAPNLSTMGGPGAGPVHDVSGVSR